MKMQCNIFPRIFSTFLLDWAPCESEREENKMADKRVAIEQCLSAAKTLRSSVSQVFEDFVSNSVGKVDLESSDLAKSSEFANSLKKDFVQVQKSVRCVFSIVFLISKRLIFSFHNSFLLCPFLYV